MFKATDAQRYGHVVEISANYELDVVWTKINNCALKSQKSPLGYLIDSLKTPIRLAIRNYNRFTTIIYSDVYDV